MKLVAPKILLLLLFVFTSACSNLEYIGTTYEVRNMNSIEGFKVSPAAAQVINSIIKGPKKTIDYYYRDQTYYYVIDAFSGSSAYEAEKNGLKIDGTTGNIYNPETKSWDTNPIKLAADELINSVKDRK